MDLQFTLQRYALQLKNQPRTLRRVARVFEKIMKTLYDTYLRAWRWSTRQSLCSRGFASMAMFLTF